MIMDKDIFQIVATLLGTALTGYIAYKMAQLKITSDKSAREMENVGINLKLAELLADKKLTKIQDVAEKTLVHVNDAFLIQLRLYSESTRLVAVLQDTAVNREKADAAEKMYKEHERKQAQARTDKQATDAVHAVAEATIKNSSIKEVTLEKPEEPAVKN